MSNVVNAKNTKTTLKVSENLPIESTDTSNTSVSPHPKINNLLYIFVKPFAVALHETEK